MLLQWELLGKNLDFYWFSINIIINIKINNYIHIVLVSMISEQKCLHSNIWHGDFFTIYYFCDNNLPLHIFQLIKEFTILIL